MCERPKIHVFLGAPPSCGEVRGRPPADFKHLKLTWQDGHLRPAAGEEDQEGPRADGTRDEPGPDGLGRPGDEEPPSESVREYLDSCFPAEHRTGSAAEPGGPHLTEQTQYLSTWTLSQALMLRARRGPQPAASPPGQTPPEEAPRPSSASSSTPDLFSPAPPSMEASGELFSHPFPSPAGPGAVVLQATPDGVLCSQTALQAPPTPGQSPACKKARPAESVAVEVSGAASGEGNVAARGCPTTPLVRCDGEGTAYSVLVAVVHPCHLKEVKVSGDKPRPHQGGWDLLTGHISDAAGQVWTGGGDVCPSGVGGRH